MQERSVNLRALFILLKSKETVSCPSGYSLLNGACVKVVEQKNCSVEIKDLSCKEARGNGW